MGTETEKFKNSKRRQKDENAIKKQTKIAKAHGAPVDEPHKLVKHHAMDCGQPGCMLCGNPRNNKMFKAKDKLTTQERRLFQDTDHVRGKHSNGVTNEDK